MKIIESNILGAEPIECAEEVGMLDTYSGLKTPFTDDIILLSPEHKTEIEELVKQAAQAYGNVKGEKEPTGVQAQFGLPALVVRVDCTIQNGQVLPYEMEDSPSGIGVSDRFIRAASGNEFKERVLEHYESTIGDTPHLIISGLRKHGTDDELVVGADKYHYKHGSTAIPAIEPGAPVIVKAIPGDAQSHLPYLELQKDCVAPLVTEGDKSYAERLGIVRTIAGPDELKRVNGELRSQVIKARLGSMAMGVSVYLTAEDRSKYGKGGLVKSGRLTRDLERYINNGGALIQDFHPPIQLVNSARRNNAILRVFVLLNRDKNSEVEARAIGGAYVARPELIVHGASNAISGAVLVE
jgi:hypothetical protein